MLHKRLLPILALAGMVVGCEEYESPDIKNSGPTLVYELTKNNGVILAENDTFSDSLIVKASSTDDHAVNAFGFRLYNIDENTLEYTWKLRIGGSNYDTLPKDSLSILRSLDVASSRLIKGNYRFEIEASDVHGAKNIQMLPLKLDTTITGNIDNVSGNLNLSVTQRSYAVVDFSTFMGVNPADYATKSAGLILTRKDGSAYITSPSVVKTSSIVGSVMPGDLIDKISGPELYFKRFTTEKQFADLQKLADDDSVKLFKKLFTPALTNLSTESDIRKGLYVGFSKSGTDTTWFVLNVKSLDELTFSLEMIYLKGSLPTTVDFSALTWDHLSTSKSVGALYLKTLTAIAVDKLEANLATIDFFVGHRSGNQYFLSSPDSTDSDLIDPILKKSTIFKKVSMTIGELDAIKTSTQLISKWDQSDTVQVRKEYYGLMVGDVFLGKTASGKPFALRIEQLNQHTIGIKAYFKRYYPSSAIQ